MAGKSVDGYIWEQSTGVVKGLETDAVVKPPQSLGSRDKVYDAVVIGAGYAGLAAARDLALSGMFCHPHTKSMCNIRSMLTIGTSIRPKRLAPGGSRPHRRTDIYCQ